MIESFRPKVFRGKSEQLLVHIQSIVDEYVEQGLRLTLRQLYYQLVSRDIIPNNDKSYKNIGSLVSDARLAGRLDWDAIEDRVRQPRKTPDWAGPANIVQACINQFRLDRWKGQAHYVELWVEKDALAGVLSPIAHDTHVTMMVNRGYSSQSAMYEASKRFIDAEQEGQMPVLLYLGDHDPSGEDMVRDIGDRLRMFGVCDLDVRKIALTMTQIKAYKPPPNPAKLTDSRARAYIEQHGRSSWEVDALRPEVLNKMIREEIEALIDRDTMDEVIEREDKDKRALAKMAKKLERDDE